MEEVEKTSEASDSEETSFKDLVTYWEGPDDLADDLVDLVWVTVKDWLKDCQSATGNFSTIVLISVTIWRSLMR